MSVLSVLLTVCPLVSDIVLLLASNSLPKSLTVPAGITSCLIVPIGIPDVGCLRYSFAKVADLIVVMPWNSCCTSSLAMLLLRAAFAAAALSYSNSCLALYSLANFIFSLAVNSD